MRLYSLIICFCLTLAPSAFAVGEAPVRISGRVSLEDDSHASGADLKPSFSRARWSGPPMGRRTRNSR